MSGIAKAIWKISPLGMLVGAFSHKKKDKPITPDANATINPLLPLSDDKNALAAKKQALAAQLTQSGRTSTILSDTTDSLGGGF